MEPGIGRAHVGFAEVLQQVALVQAGDESVPHVVGAHGFQLALRSLSLARRQYHGRGCDAEFTARIMSILHSKARKQDRRKSCDRCQGTQCHWSHTSTLRWPRRWRQPCEMPRLAELLALVVPSAEAVDVDFAAGERRLGQAPDDVRLQEHRRVVGGLLPLKFAGVERTRRLLVAQENPVVRSCRRLLWLGRWNDDRRNLEQSMRRFPSELPLEEVQLLVELVICRSCLLYTSPSPRDRTRSRMPSSA